MGHDEIVEEIHRIRDRYAQSFDYDLKAIFADLQRKQAESGRKVVSLPPKRSITSRWIGQERDINSNTKN